MKTYFKMAWRNIWRNKKRTILTISSIFIAVFLSLFTRSMQIGVYANMISNAVKFSTGHIQIHKNGYWENKSLNETFEYSSKLDSLLKKNKEINYYIPRVESFTLISSGDKTKGSALIGTDVKKENGLNKYSNKIIKGSYLNNDDKAVILGDDLATFLNVTVNDTVVLLGQGFRGVTAANQYLVKGIIAFPIKPLSKQLIIMPIEEAQYFYGLDNRITSISCMVDDVKNLDEIINKLKIDFDNNFEIMPWQDMNVELVQAIESDSVGGLIMLGILYLVIGFGIFGTVLMMTLERRKEFAVMVSVGMQKYKILMVVMIETFLIGILAVILAVIISYPAIYYFYLNPIPLSGEIANTYEMFGIEPIIPFSIEPMIFVNQTLIVILISVIAILYPLTSLLRFDVTKAMRS